MTTGGAEARERTPGRRIHERTALERHAGFFDADQDGYVSPKQTYDGLTRLGVPAPIALVMTGIINFFLGKLTQGKWSLQIATREIHRGMHPYDTGAFDKAGAIDRRAFAHAFDGPHALPPRDRLTEAELRRLIVKRNDPSKPFGAVGSVLSRVFSWSETRLLFCLAADARKSTGGDEEPAISRKTLERFYEGRLFYTLARRRRIVTHRGES
jgi:hypothetical protein